MNSKLETEFIMKLLDAIKESEKYKEFTRIFKIDMEEHDG